MSKTAHDLTRKEMKGPDRFQVVVSGLVAWLGEHQKKVALVAVALLAASAIAVGISYFVDRGKVAAGELLGKAIDAAGGRVATAPAPGAEQPVYATAEEKARAVVEASSKVRQLHQGTRAAATAALLEGEARLTLSEWDGAISAYESFLAAVPADDSLRFGALDGLARAQEGKGDLDAAARSYEKASAIGAFKDHAQLGLARVLAGAGKKDDARKALEAIAPTSPLRGEAQEQLAGLDGNG
jgi:tetratricopeptide (TPR) repeat protein